MGFKRATMDFFGAQALRRRATSILLIQFFLALSITATAAYFLFMIYIKLGLILCNYWLETYGLPLITWRWWDTSNFLFVAGTVATMITGASLYRMFQLSKPVEYVMDLVGATRVTPDTQHPPTKMFINVVEEMALASGLPVPATYVMTREPGINALAVGLSQDNAAIAVTSGTIRMLTRDELQGVIAHEFSHILNGDMALNVRLLGLLYGVDVIGYLGKRMFNFLMWCSRRGIPGQDNGLAVIAWVGFFICTPLLSLSSLGVMLGNAVRGAISRQREYLADASAVQFTRNPPGITGALKKIGGLLVGSSISSPSAMYASHFFFSSSAPTSKLSTMSDRSHPPLLKRIQKIDPDFNGEFPYIPSFFDAMAGPEQSQDWLPKKGEQPRNRSAGAAAQLANPDEIIGSIGAPEGKHLLYMTRLLATIPASVSSTIHDLSGAEAFLYALLIQRDPAISARQLDHLRQNADVAVSSKVHELATALADAPHELRLPMLDMAIPTLKLMTKEAYLKLASNIASLIMADNREDLFEFILRKVITRHLEPCFTESSLEISYIDNIRQIKEDSLLLLAHVSTWVTLHDEHRTLAFSKDKDRLVPSPAPSADRQGNPPPQDPGFAALDAALDRISTAKTHVKKQVLMSCISCVTADGMISPLETELLRAIADALKLNLPPILTGTVNEKYARTTKGL